MLKVIGSDMMAGNHILINLEINHDFKNKIFEWLKSYFLIGISKVVRINKDMM